MPTLSLWQDVLQDGLTEAVAAGELRADAPREAILALLRSVTYGQQVVQVTSHDAPELHLAVLESILSPWRTLAE